MHALCATGVATGVSSIALRYLSLYLLPPNVYINAYMCSPDQEGLAVWLRTSISGSHDRSGTYRQLALPTSLRLFCCMDSKHSFTLPTYHRRESMITQAWSALAATSRFWLRERGSQHDRRASCLSPDHPWPLSSGLAARGLWIRGSEQTMAPVAIKLYIYV